MRSRRLFRNGLQLLLMAVLIVGAVLTLSGGPVLAQKSPFGVPVQTDQQAISESPVAPATGLSFAGRFWAWVQTTQRTLHRQLAGAIRGLKSGEGFAAVWLLASLSFVYGIVHAVGPGHGKAVISSYVLANERTVRRGVLLSFLASGTQAITAILLVGILAVILNAAGFRIKAIAAQMETASYALIAIVGAWLLFAQGRRIWSTRNSGPAGSAAIGNAADHACCGHAHLPDARSLEQAADWKGIAAIVLAVGLRPCTGALVVLVFAFANGLFLAGVGATFAMALGTAITVSSLAVLAVGSREVALQIAGPESRWADRIFNTIAVGASVLVLALGVALFIGSLGPARPF